jgi:glycosyltransferase involved in cell wall biosynthesis
MHENPASVNPRLLIDGRSLLEPQGGGVFEYTRRMTNALRASGRLDVTVWANALRAGKAEGIDAFTRFPNKVLNASLKAFGGPGIERLSGIRADLLWMPNPHFAPAPASLPLAITIHDLSFELYPEFFSLKQRLWHRAVAPGALTRRAAVVLAVSETTKRDIVERWGVPPERIAVTQEGAAPEFFEAPSDEELSAVRRKRRLPERFILHVGTMEPRKNHLALLAAYHQLRPQARYGGLGLVLAGPSGWRNDDVLRAIRRSPYRQDIKLLGFVTPAERRALYRCASVLAFPSFYEGFALPPLEAMASGLPVVGSSAGAIGEVVCDAGILADPYRPAELAEAIAAVLDSPSLAKLYATRGQARAALFDWEGCAKKAEVAFAGVLA